MALTTSECAAMIEAAARNRVNLGVGFNNRYNPVFQAMADQVRKGQIGDVHTIDAFWGSMGRDRVSWRADAALAGGGCLMDAGVHVIDLVLQLTRQPIHRLQAMQDTQRYGWPLDEMTLATLGFAGGIHAVLHISQAFRYGRNGIVVHGSRGCLAAWKIFRRQLVEPPVPSGYLVRFDNERQESTEYPAGDLFAYELDAFGQAVLKGLPPDIPGIDGLQVQGDCGSHPAKRPAERGRMTCQNAI